MKKGQIILQFSQILLRCKTEQIGIVIQLLPCSQFQFEKIAIEVRVQTQPLVQAIRFEARMHTFHQMTKRERSRWFHWETSLQITNEACEFSVCGEHENKQKKMPPTRIELVTLRSSVLRAPNYAIAAHSPTAKFRIYPISRLVTDDRCASSELRPLKFFGQGKELTRWTERQFSTAGCFK